MGNPTPGPWTILPNNVCVIGPHTERDRPTALVANCGAAWREPEQCEANARLISAAPELLEACEAWVMYIESNAGCNPPLAFTREAIKKARGQ